MTGIIGDLREKTDKEKKRIAFTASFLVTLVILIFWILSFTGGFGAEEVEEIEADSTISPIKAFIENFKTGIGEITETVSDFRGQ